MERVGACVKVLDGDGHEDGGDGAFKSGGLIIQFCCAS